MKILVIEDEFELANDIVSYLSTQQYNCEHVSNYSDAIDKLSSYSYDCILLDIMLPDGNGMELLDFIKKQGKEDGVLIISAKDALDDKIKGIQLGADDYLAKPFHLPELAVRIYSIIRRRQFSSSNLFVQKELTIDIGNKTVFINENEVVLTRKEFELLIYLVGNRNKVLSKSILAEHLSGDLADMLDSHNFVYAHVKNLKRKLNTAGCSDYLKTVYGTGYKWEA